MLDRRGFLKFIGGAAVGTLATPVVWQGLDDISIWSQNWGWIPKLDYGNNDFTSVRTVSKICPSAVGVEVRLVGGRPVRVVGDPHSPLSRGGVSALATTEVQLRYSPARLKRPLLRSADGGYREISWDAAEKLLAEKLAAARKAGGATGKKDRLVCISGDDNGTMSELFSGLAAQMGDSRFFVMPGDAQTTAVAWGLMGGKGRAGFDFERSDYVLAVGANVLETWGTVISNRRAWGSKRPFGAEPSMRLAYAGPAQNNTAAGADAWLPIKPGTELFLLLGIARQLLQDGASARGDLALFRAAVEPWTPEKACAACGLPLPLFTAAVDSLKKARAPLVIVGSDMDQGGGVGPARLGIAINLLLGRLNREGGLRAIPVAPPVARGAAPYEARMTADLAGYALKAAKGETPEIDVLMVHEANPLYALPGRTMEAVFRKSAFSVTFSCFFDETARQCDLILPAALGLERYDDVAQPFGFGRFIYTLARPVAEPLYEARRGNAYRCLPRDRHRPWRGKRDGYAAGQGRRHRRELGGAGQGRLLCQRRRSERSGRARVRVLRGRRGVPPQRDARPACRRRTGRGLCGTAGARHAGNRHPALQHENHFGNRTGEEHACGRYQRRDAPETRSDRGEPDHPVERRRLGAGAGSRVRGRGQ